MAIAPTFTSIKDPGMQHDLRRFADAVSKTTPFSKFQFVRVSFTTADQDTDILHDLNPDDPESIHYVIVGSNLAVVVYQDLSATRKPWQPTHIFLRANGICEVILLLFVGATDVTFFA